MKHLLPLLFLIASPALAAAPAAAANASPTTPAEERELYSATLEGELTVDAEGRVVDVRLEPRHLGEVVMSAYEARARGWRFQPVLEAGKPVAAKAHFRLDVLAVRGEGRDAHLGVQSLRFYEPDAASTDAERTRLQSVRMNPPRYPRIALQAGVGALVVVWVDVGADGRAAAVGTDQVSVLHANVSDSGLPRWGRMFREAAEASIAQWHFPGYEGTVVKVPMRFNPPGLEWDRWNRTWPVELERPAWMREPSVATRLVALDSEGRRVPDRLRLQSAL